MAGDGTNDVDTHESQQLSDRRVDPASRLQTHGPIYSLIIVVVLFIAAAVFMACSSGSDKQNRAVVHMEWCHQMGGTYWNQLSLDWVDGSPRFVGAGGDCEIPPQGSTPNDCYTAQDNTPPGVPRGVNWYAYYLLSKGGAGAGGLDEYDHCKALPVVQIKPLKLDATRSECWQQNHSCNLRPFYSSSRSKMNTTEILALAGIVL